MNCGTPKIGNTYFAYTHLSDFTAWSELFGLSEEDPIFQKRVLAVISGAILPLVSLGFIKALVDYIRPGSDIEEEKAETNFIEEDKEENTIQNEEDKEEIKNDIESPRKLKDTIYYDLDPTKIT